MYSVSRNKIVSISYFHSEGRFLASFGADAMRFNRIADVIYHTDLVSGLEVNI